MRIRALPFWVLLTGLLVAGGASAQSGQHASVALEQADISINSRADTNGYIRFRITPVGGQALEATVDILAKQGENDIADDVFKAITIALGDKYEVKVGGETVRIRKLERTAPNFTVEIAFNTPGLGISIAN